MIRKLGTAQYVAELRQQAGEMSRHAWSLLRMADNLARESEGPRDFADETTTGALAYEHEQLLAAMAERSLTERARRRRLFANRIFGECGWDVLLILYRNRVQGRRSVPHNIALEIDSTVCEVEGLIKILIDEALVEWCVRSHFLRLSDAGAARIRAFFLDEDADPSLGQDTLMERKCA